MWSRLLKQVDLSIHKGHVENNQFLMFSNVCNHIPAKRKCHILCLGFLCTKIFIADGRSICINVYQYGLLNYIIERFKKISTNLIFFSCISASARRSSVLITSFIILWVGAKLTEENTSNLTDVQGSGQ